MVQNVTNTQPAKYEKPSVASYSEQELAASIEALGGGHLGDPNMGS